MKKIFGDVLSRFLMFSPTFIGFFVNFLMDPFKPVNNAQTNILSTSLSHHWEWQLAASISFTLCASSFVVHASTFDKNTAKNSIFHMTILSYIFEYNYLFVNVRHLWQIDRQKAERQREKWKLSFVFWNVKTNNEELWMKEAKKKKSRQGFQGNSIGWMLIESR